MHPTRNAPSSATTSRAHTSAPAPRISWPRSPTRSRRSPPKWSPNLTTTPNDLPAIDLRRHRQVLAPRKPRRSASALRRIAAAGKYATTWPLARPPGPPDAAMGTVWDAKTLTRPSKAPILQPEVDLTFAGAVDRVNLDGQVTGSFPSLRASRGSVLTRSPAASGTAISVR
jgi:hypothetical protein